MKKLDLHGVRHCDVRDVVDEFLSIHILQWYTGDLHIITGYSDKMKELVSEVVYEYKLELSEHQFNKGMLIIKL